MVDGAGPLSPADAPVAGSLLDDRYRLEVVIGEGGMARVFRATDEALGRTVAIKVFRDGSIGHGDRERTDSETRLLASLSHPSLVTLFDAKVSGSSRAYLVMEFIDGETLADRIRTGPMPPSDVGALATALGEALHVVHASGVVHRDIKPSNILLRPPLLPGHGFRATLADFGIAHLVDTARVTSPGTVIGTAAYIAPEQLQGAGPSSAADVYSLGLVLIEALTGARAFPQRSSHEAMGARLVSEPDVPGLWGYGWRSLLTAMTARDPRARPSAAQVAVDARALAVEVEVTTGPEEPDQTRDLDSTDAVHASGLAAADGGSTIPLVGNAAHGDTGRSTSLPDAPTRVLTPAASRGEETPSAGPSRLPNSAGSGRRRWMIGLAAAGAAGAVAIGSAIAVSLASPAPGAPAPALPTLEEPIDSHLEQLMDAVTP